jgi:hypothetical protein
MKNTSTPAPLLLGCLVAMLQFTCLHEACAFGGAPGGPFSNGSYFPNDGTFSAVVRGENLSGTVQFSTSSDTASSGVSTIYYDGDSYTGNSQGNYDPQGSTMTVNFQADIEGQGQNSISVGKQVTNTTTINGTTTTSTTTIPYREIRYFDSLYLNGSAECQTSNVFPNQKFIGAGEAQFQQLVYTGYTPFLDADTIPVSVSGVRLSNTSVTFATADVRPPSVNEFSILVP